MIKDIITKAIKDVSSSDTFSVDTPQYEDHGDYSTNVAMIQAKAQGSSPRELAEELVQKLSSYESLSEIVEKIEIAGPGFINFFIKTEYLIKVGQNVLDSGDEFGKTKSRDDEKIMVEFAHPNTHKAFHIGHLRNITTGETVVRLLEAVGVEVIRANYQGDVGMHIAKALWGIQKLGFEDKGDVQKNAEFLGKAYATGATAYKDDEEVKEEIHTINKKIYSKDDKEINNLYKTTRQWSLDYFNSIYKRVYTHFDRFYFESETADSGKKNVEVGLEKGVFKESKGAVIFEGSKYGLHDRVFITGEGVPTYEAKDMGLVELQLSEYNPDKIVHVVGPEQIEYFKVVFKAQEKLFPETKGKQKHIPYGWVRLKEGKMSSRTGNVILGESLLDEAKESIMKEYKASPEKAEKIGVAAVKYSFLRVGRAQDIAFDMKESISMEGNSGPYLQYTYARTQSLLLKSKEVYSHNMPSDKETIKQLNVEELSVLKLLPKFSETIEIAAKSYSPNLLCNYLYELASKYNSFYNAHKIMGSEKEEFRLALTAATGIIIKNGLGILGIKAPEKM